MTRTSWSSANSRSARWEPMKPPPPVIRTFTERSFRRQQILELVLAIVEQALPQLEAEQPPGLPSEAVLPLEAGEHAPVVEQLSAERLGTREDLGHELARRAPEPLLERHREAHLIRAVRDHVRHQ